MIKRYNFKCVQEEDKPQLFTKEESIKGEFYKCSDIDPLLNNYHKLLNRMVIDDNGIHFELKQEFVDGIRVYDYELPEVSRETKKCNCEKKASEIDRLIGSFGFIKEMKNGYAIVPVRDWWVCPIHGYKKR